MSKEKYKLFQWCPVQEKVVPVEEVQVRVHANARHMFINDEMPPTRNPLNPKEIYTSKSKLRQAYRDAGAVEVGDAYDRGYDPDKEKAKDTERLTKNIMEQIRHRLNG